MRIIASIILVPWVLQSLLFLQDGTAVDSQFNKLTEDSSQYWELVNKIQLTTRGQKDVLEKHLNSNNELQQLAAVYILLKEGSDQKYLTKIIDLTASKNDFVQNSAVSAFSRLIPAKDLEEGVKDACVKQLKGIFASTDDLTKVRISKIMFNWAGILDSRKTVLKLFTDTRSKQIKDEAALCLAGMMLFPQVKAHIKKLSEEPSHLGEIARSVLEKNHLADIIDRSSSSKPKYDFSLLEGIIDLLLNQYDDPSKIDPIKIIERAAKAICSSLDPHTIFMDKKDIEKLQKEDLEGKYGGIGARVSMRKDRAGIRWLTIEESILGGPCHKANLRSGDKIIRVEGESTANGELIDIVEKLRGKPGTPVKIEVFSLRWEKPIEIALTREEIKLDLIGFGMLPGDIGYIQFVSFSKDSDKLIKGAIDSLKGAKGLVLDLRGNPGGYLDAAVRVANLFLDQGKVVTEKMSKNPETSDKVKEVFITSETKYTDLPLVILVDGGSASASEIIAGALKEHNRAAIIGEKTFGKGSVQQIYPLDAELNNAVKITIAKWYLPSGESVQEKGVEPNVEAKFPEPDLWKLREFERIRSTGLIDTYVNAQYSNNVKLFKELSEYDSFDHSLYPGFEDLYKQLNTRATSDEIRELLREYVRHKVAEESNRKLYYDYQTDSQLQIAIRKIAEMCNIEITNFKQYANFAKIEDKNESPVPF
ncbi:MAG: S41 family peptidase [Planctomycetes bacterium]|nr:S41 family peptidase [Planctomycetota bacterium]